MSPVYRGQLEVSLSILAYMADPEQKRHVRSCSREARADAKDELPVGQGDYAIPRPTTSNNINKH